MNFPFNNHDTISDRYTYIHEKHFLFCECDTHLDLLNYNDELAFILRLLYVYVDYSNSQVLLNLKYTKDE